MNRSRRGHLSHVLESGPNVVDVRFRSRGENTRGTGPAGNRETPLAEFPPSAFSQSQPLRAPDDLRSMTPREVRLNKHEHVSGPARASTILAAVARDVHFWVPVIVLIGGLILLRWVS